MTHGAEKEAFLLHQIDITRKLLEATVDKALRDLQTDTERSVRNLVDLAQNFSNGRFQKDFFSIIQTLLEDQSSAYYALVRRIVNQVDHRTLKTFGINLGYNGCTVGAKTIRQNEQKLRFNIPWSIAFMLDSADGCVSAEEIARTIEQGKTLGVYTYLLFCRGATARTGRRADARFPRLRLYPVSFPKRPGRSDGRHAGGMP